jgi:hypothetical protein
LSSWWLYSYYSSLALPSLGIDISKSGKIWYNVLSVITASRCDMRFETGCHTVVMWLPWLSMFKTGVSYYRYVAKTKASSVNSGSYDNGFWQHKIHFEWLKWLPYGCHISASMATRQMGRSSKPKLEISAGAYDDRRFQKGLAKSDHY